MTTRNHMKKIATTTTNPKIAVCVVKNIECNNINVNNNGFNGATLPTALNGLATDEEQA